MFDKEKPISTPCDVSDDNSAFGYIDLYFCRISICRNIFNRDVIRRVEVDFDFADGGLQEVNTCPNSTHIGQSGRNTDGTVAAHAEISNVVEEDGGSNTVGRIGLQQPCADDHIRAARLTQNCAPHPIVIAPQPCHSVHQ